ncbi:4'-phosphopantetheinyl transferase superfamily protein [Cupriavidus sp. AU9028]|nr:4'-phosphopantetheinyl transferase superfamily protein [Cupriavidus sp. AU9028]MBY4899190.1 4'-phosphopantetheinyl transferase superfamily protein [Cupriavidus sp. AU9028]
MEIRNHTAFGSTEPLPSPVPQVGLWLLELREDADAATAEATVFAAASTLSADELARCAALKRPADRVRFAATRSALRRLLAERMDCSATSLAFATSAFGKPLLAKPGAPRFNVSHAGGCAAIAIADSGDVGIDIERVNTDLAQQELRAMAAHCFTRRERGWLEGHAPQEWPGAFHTLWSRKEALLKALGLGIADHLQHVSVAIASEGEGRGNRSGDTVRSESARLAITAGELARIRLHGLQAPAGYVAAMAWVPPA